MKQVPSRTKMKGSVNAAFKRLRNIAKEISSEEGSSRFTIKGSSEETVVTFNKNVEEGKRGVSLVLQCEFFTNKI